jgi:FkbM family methyltransferase
MINREGLSRQLVEVFQALQDEQSRSHFIRMFQFMLSGDFEARYDMVDMAIQYAKNAPPDSERRLALGSEGEIIESISDFLKKDGHKHIKVVLFGAGKTFDITTRVLSRYDLNILYICDSDEKKQGFVKNGLRVISPSQLLALPDDVHVIISAFHATWSIYYDLRAAGFPGERVYSLLSPEIQYFGPEFLQPLPNEMYVDCGACDVVTIENFITFCNGIYNKIIAFEPDKNSFQNILSEMGRKNIEKTEVINKGVWHENTTIGFSCNQNLPSMSMIDTNSPVHIELTTIDNVVGNAAVTFIKMDIEGAELEALYGAAETIKRHKPRLAISIYHKANDVIDIPAYILSLVPEYKLYIRQYSYFLGEIILYAVID